MLSWHHSGFNGYIGDKIESDDKAGLGNLARYIIRACFSQERMVYMVCIKFHGIPMLFQFKGLKYNEIL